MADCPNCGKKIGFLIKTNCKSCGIKYCNDCGEQYGSGIGSKTEKDTEGRPFTEHFAFKSSICKPCITRLESMVTTEAHGTNPYGACPACGYDSSPTKYRFSLDEKVNFAFPNENGFTIPMLCLQAYCPKCTKVYSKRYLWVHGSPYDGPANWDDPKWWNYSQARLAESVERIEDAANHYEKAGLLEKSKQLRIKNKNQVVHHITIDVNKMLDFLKESNFTIPYKCPSCHGTVKLNGQRDANSFFICEYCGTSLQTVDVQNMISAMM